MLYIGIGPGAGGALACLSEGHDPLLLLKPKASGSGYAQALIECLSLAASHHGRCIAALEKPSASSRQCVSSMHQDGRNAGGWEGALAALSIPYLLVAPRHWQTVALDPGGDAPNVRSLAMARRLWPGLTLGTTDDGVADALHIARWCRMQQAPAPVEVG